MFLFQKTLFGPVKLLHKFTVVYSIRKLNTANTSRLKRFQNLNDF